MQVRVGASWPVAAARPAARAGGGLLLEVAASVRDRCEGHMAMAWYLPSRAPSDLDHPPHLHSGLHVDFKKENFSLLFPFPLFQKKTSPCPPLSSHLKKKEENK
jgi:hypothetical protein